MQKMEFFERRSGDEIVGSYDLPRTEKTLGITVITVDPL